MFQKVCENCGRKFSTKIFWARFCSTLCRVQWHRKQSLTQAKKVG